MLGGLTTLATKLIGGAGVAVSTAVFARMVVVVAALGPWLRLRHPEQLKVSRRDFAGACLVTAGVTCSVLTPEWTLNTQIDVRGLFWGAVAVVGLAGQTLLVRATVTRGGIGRWGFFYYTHLGGMFWIGLYITLTGQWGEFARITPYIAALVLVPTLTGCLLGYSLYYKSLEYVPASVSSLMASLEILSGTALTALATNVAPTAPEIVGCVCIFAAIALVSLSRLEKVPLRS